MTDKKLYVEIPAKGYGTTFREATAEETALALQYQEKRKELELIIEQAEKNLKNLDEEASKSSVANVFFDEAGFIYTTRYFVATGNFASI